MKLSNFLLEHLVFPVFGKGASYIIRELPVPMPVPRDKDDEDIQRILKENGIKFSFRNYATHRDIQSRILELIKNFKTKHYGNRWLDAKFHIVFEDCIADDVNLIDFLKAGIVLRPEVLEPTLQYVIDVLSEYPGEPRMLDEIFRDSFEGSGLDLRRGLKEKSRACLEDPKEQERFRFNKEIRKSKPLHKIYPDEDVTVDDLKRIWDAQKDAIGSIRSLAKSANTPPTHAIASFFGEFEGSKKFMVITASGIDKRKAVCPTHSPVVIKKDDFYMYGYENVDSSTETKSHWSAYEEMKKRTNSIKWPWIIHAHCHNIMEKSKKPEEKFVHVGPNHFPIISKQRHGTEELGRAMVNELIEHDTDGVVLSNHGLWLFGENINELTERMISLEKQSSGDKID